MRFDELRLLAYGPFTDCTLTLQPGLNLLYGPNEAGKSSALRAVRGLLFGIGERTADSFLHTNPQLRVGAALIDANGQRIECVRRKGRKTTLRDGSDDQPIDEDKLQQLLGGVTEDFFNAVFGIDHSDLRHGGADVVRGKGRVGELLFAAGGVTHLREKQAALEGAAAELYKPGGSKPPINQAISKAKALKSEIVTLQRSPEEWSRSHDEMKRLEALESSLKEQIDEAGSNRERLSRIKSALPSLGALRAKRASLESLADVVLLPPDVAERFGKAKQQLTVASTQAQRATERVKALQEQLEAVAAPSALLAEAPRIEALYRRLGSHEAATIDRPKLEGQRRDARDSAKRAIRRLGWSATIDEAERDQLSDDKKARVRVLASQHGGFRQAAEQPQKAVDRLQAREAELSEQLAEEVPAKPTPALEDAIAGAAAVEAADQRFMSLGEEVGRLRSDARQQLARLTGWEGGLEELGRLRVPLVESVDQLDERLQQLVAKRERLAADKRALRESLRLCREKLSAIELADSVLTEEELTSRREVRDQGVRLARQSLLGAAPDPEEVANFLQQVHEGSDLPTALEPSVREADRVVDRLRREADRVAEKAQLLAQQRSLEAEAGRVQEARDSLEQQHAAWDQDWAACWQQSGVAPGTPKEMRAWLRIQYELVESADRLAAAEATQEDHRQRVERAAAALGSELANAGVAVPSGASLETLRRLAEQSVRRAAESVQLHEQRRSELDRVRSEKNEAEHEASRAAAALEAWRRQWAAALEPLRLPADALPEQAEAVIVNLDELARSLDLAEGYRRRLWGIDKTAEEFAEDARRVAVDLAPELAEDSVEKIATGLHHRLGDARAAAKRQEALAGDLAEEQHSLEAAEASLAEGGAILEALVAQAGCASPEGLPAAIEASVEKQRLIDGIEESATQLAPFCAGHQLDEFAAEAEREDPDRLPGQIDALGSRIKSLIQQRDAAIEGRQREASKLDQLNDAAAAADKANERQFLVSRLEADTREYLVTTVASRLLQKAIRRYQEKAQGPVLAGASAHFSTLTCGAFQGFKPDFDASGHEVLVGVRADGTTLRVEGMSEGTLDQVYLALRLGTIDYWLERHGPIPLIVDDVLMTFDDARATAALRTLLDLSCRTQVLFFTHHEHLVSLAREAAKWGASDTSVNVLAEWGSSRG